MSACARRVRRVSTVQSDFVVVVDRTGPVSGRSSTTETELKRFVTSTLPAKTLKAVAPTVDAIFTSMMALGANVYALPPAGTVTAGGATISVSPARRQPHSQFEARPPATR